MSDEVIKILDDLGRRFGIVIDWSSEKCTAVYSRLNVKIC